MGLTLEDLDRLYEAEASYERALALTPDYLEAHNYLGRILKKLGRLGEAEISYARAIALNSNYVEAHSNLGDLLLTMGRHSEALSEKKKGGGFISFDLSSGWRVL